MVPERVEVCINTYKTGFYMVECIYECVLNVYKSGFIQYFCSTKKPFHTFMEYIRTYTHRRAKQMGK